MEFYAVERKKELLPFMTAWMELESIMLSEISQLVKDKYHMISPLTETKQTNKQSITKDTETENRLTVTRGEGISGGKGEWFVGAIIKDTWTITRGGGNRREVERSGGWTGVRGLRQKTVLEQ